MKKFVVLLSSLLFAASVAAVDCSDCHETIDQAMHKDAEATLATCNDCHGMADAHTVDMELHTPDLTMAECADCHGME
ncbi:cytochrome c3 family protein [Shewanella sp. Isolate11]|uniref:cytochrome c3 family protein n=1 Tax=Shewanella sp. Isolate11 TaxID=2908530 RepID=UPI001EFD25D0|nr:cytochrome c3 family protein [Shewanella sp. Isolate11]MCG9697749.1 hypothetical protein [Shewanella sp. Isolate11]